MKSYLEKVKEIQDELKWNPDLFESEIHIEINDGIVTLTGDVESEEKKREAGEVAGKVEGIKSVVNKLQVSKQHHHHEAPAEVPSPNSGDPDMTLKVSGA
jgi:Flp pilus assembly secretin CpaC